MPRVIMVSGFMKSLLRLGGTLIVLSTTVFDGQAVKPPSTSPAPYESTSVAIPKFEVVSVKLNKSGSTSVSGGFLVDGYSAENVPLLMLIRTAYWLFDAPDEQFERLPKWANNERFDVVAKVNSNDIAEFHKITREQRGMMLQSVLANRFMLKTHFESKELPVYTLLVAKSGSKLEVAKQGETPSNTSKGSADPKHNPGSLSRTGPGQLQGQAADMWALTAVLTQILGRPVLDKTGLRGQYNFELNWQPEDFSADRLSGTAGTPEETSPQSQSSFPSIFPAMQEQLGLKLRPTKGPVNVLIIDRVEEPSAN
jgi:uncharacterized protein (TIGR03435 family)